LGTRKQSYFNGGNWIADFLKGESEFQLRGERFGARIIDNIEVGDEPKTRCFISASTCSVAISSEE